MKLLYIGSTQFFMVKDKIYSFPSSGDSFFEKYLDVFEKIRVIGVKTNAYIDKTKLVEIKDERIEVGVTLANGRPSEVKNDRIVKEFLRNEIQNAEAILIKPASRRGVFALKIAKKLNKPYMIELTGDLYAQLKQKKNIIKRMYAPYLYYQVKKEIRECNFGLYVSEEYLQKVYPISGLKMGCSDVILKNFDEKVISKRIDMINNINLNSQINLILIGFYQSNSKGLDTAIECLADLPQNIHLNILGHGVERNRLMWKEFAKKYDVSDRIHFMEPLSSTEEVLKMIDSQDIFILPSRSEGFGRVIAEAMSRGCPCICSNTGAIPELITNRWLHKVGDANELSDLISKMLESKENMIRVSRENYEYSKKFDFEILRKQRNEFLMKFKFYCERYSKL